MNAVITIMLALSALAATVAAVSKVAISVGDVNIQLVAAAVALYVGAVLVERLS